MDEPVNDEGKGNLGLVYGQLCESYRKIDDTRSKLLELLPLATGVGIFLLSDKSELPAVVGLFGFVATLGLFSYELHGIKKCAALIDAGQLIEAKLGINGQFLRRPGEVAGFIDEPFAASIIYPASLAGWVFLALLDSPAWFNYVSAMSVFFVGFLGSLRLIRLMEADVAERLKYDKEPQLFSRSRRRPFNRGRPEVSELDVIPDDAYVKRPRG